MTGEAGTAEVRTGRAPDLDGRSVLIAAGPTREPLDPVRYLSNRSSGRMGIRLAEAALDRGARVVLVLGPTAVAPPSDGGAGAISTVPVETALEMREEVSRRADRSDAVVMAAAVADFRPADGAGAGKIKRAGRTGMVLRLEANPDILAGLGAGRASGRGPRVLVGFAAETEDPEAEAVRKLRDKKCDLVVGNRVGGGRVFGSDETEAVLVERAPGDGPPTVVRPGPQTKRALAHAVLDVVSRRLGNQAEAPAE